MIIYGDCLTEMAKMEENSIDFIVTDPPYGLHFMGKDWDGRIPAIEVWAEALRICKPGSMLAAFGGSRTHHHLMCAIEGAGWEIRDVIMYLYGSGFPKSHNFGRKIGGEWSKYGTALKPAHEPIILAMKPLDGTFAQNAEKWGVAGINVDDSRIEFSSELEKEKHSQEWNRNWTTSPIHAFDKAIGNHPGGKREIGEGPKPQNGRWPANVIFDEEAAQQLDEMTGVLKSGSGIKNPIGGAKTVFRASNWKDSGYIQGDSGGASRFFYCAKASSSERGKDNIHPTVKPLALMKYLIKLLAPPGNPILLDPFCGSGSTLVAAKEIGIRAIGIEKQKDYCEIAEKRVDSVEINLFNYREK